MCATSYFGLAAPRSLGDAGGGWWWVVVGVVVVVVPIVVVVVVVPMMHGREAGPGLGRGLGNVIKHRDANPHLQRRIQIVWY